MTVDWLGAILPIKSEQLKETVFSTLRALGLPEAQDQ
jgi:hypothetical protein